MNAGMDASTNPQPSTEARAASERRKRTLVAVALLAVYLIWGSTYLCIRWALVSFPPFFQMSTRFLAAGAVLMAWSLWRREKLPAAREWRNALVLGTLMLGGGFGLTAVSEKSIGSGLVAAFIAVSPMWMCAWGFLFGQRPSRGELAGMAVGLAGVLLLMRGASFSASPFGMIALLGATLAWTLGSVLQMTRMPLATGAMGTASEMLCGGAMLMAFSLAAGEQFTWPPQPLAALAWSYLVVFGSLAAFSAYLYLLANSRPATASSYAFVNPVIALALGVLLGDERVAGGEWLACGVILAGVALIFRGKTASRAR
jgi:drug/metabolite transporter (DMT)-like permease